MAISALKRYFRPEATRGYRVDRTLSKAEVARYERDGVLHPLDSSGRAAS
jgi:hypothetical protein